MEKAIDELKVLFESAKQKNEFEFVMTLLNYKSVGSPQVQANLHEWFEALSSYKIYFESCEGKEKTRMATLLYSTFFENSDFYNIIGSLCRVVLGYRASSYLFWKTKKYERLLGVGEKIEFLSDLLTEVGMLEINSFLNENYYPAIRNSFFHSAYSLSDNEYILHDSESILIGHVHYNSFKIDEFFYPMVQKVVVFFESFKTLYTDNFESYTQDKIIGQSPLGSNTIIIGTPEGLGGIRIPKAVSFYGKLHDSGIWFNPIFDSFAAHNLNINFPQIEHIEIIDQLKRYESKQSVRVTDVGFNTLLEKISERKEQDEVSIAITLLIKLGNIKISEMEAEENIHKKKSYVNIILFFFEKASEINGNIVDLNGLDDKIKNLRKLLINPI